MTRGRGSSVLSRVPSAQPNIVARKLFCEACEGALPPYPGRGRRSRRWCLGCATPSRTAAVWRAENADRVATRDASRRRGPIEMPCRDCYRIFTTTGRRDTQRCPECRRRISAVSPGIGKGRSALGHWRRRARVIAREVSSQAVRICRLPQCQRAFLRGARWTNGRYCSDACRTSWAQIDQAHRYQQRRRPPLELRIVTFPGCGHTGPNRVGRFGPTKTIFCSKSCLRKAMRKARRERDSTYSILMKGTGLRVDQIPAELRDVATLRRRLNQEVAKAWLTS